MNLVSAILVLFSWFSSPNEEAIQDITTIKEQMKGYYSTNLDSAAILAQQIVIKSKKIGYELGLAKGEFAVAYVAHKQNKTDKAIKHFLKALDLYRNLNINDALVDRANICISLGKIFRMNHSIDEAISFYDEGLKYAAQANNTMATIKLLNNKAIAYRYKGEYCTALDLQLQKLDLTPIENRDARYKAFNQLGLIYHDLQDYDQALIWYQKIIDMELDTKSSKYKAWAYHNMASTYREMQNQTLAWQSYKNSLEAIGEKGAPQDLFINYHEMAELAISQNQPEIALPFAKKALVLLSDVSKTPDSYSIYKLLSACYRKGDSNQALAYLDDYTVQNEIFLIRQKNLVANGEKYKVNLIASNYFSKVKRQKDQLKMAWTMSCAAAFIFLAIVLSFKLYRIYSYRSPELALSHIKSQNEMIYLLDLFRKEKEEMKNTLRQSK